MQEVTAPVSDTRAATISSRTVDIAEASRYDAVVGAKHHVGRLRIDSNARRVRIELRVDKPEYPFSVVVDREACQTMQVEYACHERK